MFYRMDATSLEHVKASFNIMSLTPGVKLAPRGELGPKDELCPLGGMFTTLFTPRGEHSLLFRRMEGRTDNFTPRGSLYPYGDKAHLWESKYATREKLKICLRSSWK
jgi:hypothetical protein